ncbi:MAG: RdgB/HAM1 family non-canonical purine NTP pyrophosphatase [Cytophagales bacterium]|nr:MAG: RdgB/HAM1 family non-canonical purine NTP pyrophosphatase [Cytophagales bacterium]
MTFSDQILCFATRNQGKIKEIGALLPPHLVLKSLDEIGCFEELEETTDTLEGNSLQKAAYVWEKYQCNCFADDSGLFIDALAGRPGVHSAYYAGEPRSYERNVALVLEEMKNETHRNAHFKTVITCIIAGNVHQFTGILEGKIIHTPQGSNGFGYDPIFLPKGYTQTLAEISPAEKNKISHRSLAFSQMKNFLHS